MAVVRPSVRALSQRNCQRSKPPSPAQLVQAGFEGEVGLVHAEAAEGAAGRVVGDHRGAVHPHVGHIVGRRRVGHRPLDHRQPHAGVGAAVGVHGDHHAGQAAVLVAAHGVVHDDGVALGVHAQRILPGQLHQGRLAGQPCDQGRVALGGDVLLAAEAAAVLHLHHVHQGLRQAEQKGELVAVLVDALAAAVDLHAGLAVLLPGQGQGGFGFQEGVLHPLGGEAVAGDEGGAREGRLGVADRYRGPVQHIAREHRVDLGGLGPQGLEEVGDRGQHLVLDHHLGGRLARDGLGFRRHRRQHIAHEAGGFALGHQHRPVQGDGAHLPLARDILRGEHLHHAGHRQGLRDIDAQHLGPGMVGVAQRPEDHPGLLHVGHEHAVAQDGLPAGVLAVAGAHPASALGLLHGFALAQGFGRAFDGVDDLLVTGAAADVPRQSGGDLLPGGARVLGQHRLGLHDDAGGAEAALHAALGYEGVGEHLPLPRRQPLGGDEGLALQVLHLHAAAQAGGAIHQDGAAPADALARAPVLGADEARHFAQVGEHIKVKVGGEAGLLTVECEFHRKPRVPASMLPAPGMANPVILGDSTPALDKIFINKTKFYSYWRTE